MDSFPDLGMRLGCTYLPPSSRSLVSVGRETCKGLVDQGRRERKEAWPKQLSSPVDLCWARPTLPSALPLSRAATPLGPRNAPEAGARHVGWKAGQGLLNFQPLLHLPELPRQSPPSCMKPAPPALPPCQDMPGGHSPQLSLGPRAWSRLVSVK